MKVAYKPKNDLEKFGLQVFSMLVENFPQTFFVGGTVRDLLRRKQLSDIDLATTATPAEVVNVLKKFFIEYNLGYQNMGVVLIPFEGHHVSITTFRKDLPSTTRYPEVEFTKNIKVDAKRRDFTVNALYFQPHTGLVQDFFGGLSDLQKKRIKFIGNSASRIKEDPLRILRALRFSLELNFSMERNTKSAIKKYFHLVKNLTGSRVEKEMEKISSEKNKKIFQKVINTPEVLDKYF